MATSLAAIRAKLQEQSQFKNNIKNKNSGNSDKSVFPHWNIADDASAKLRFLPDADDSNPLFWVERNLISLPFSGIKGKVDSAPVTIKVPCIDMYNPSAKSTCPILAEIRPWFNNEDTKELASAYWKKRQYFFQGFVRENPIKDEETPENPIRRFIISPQIYNLVIAALNDPELENTPTNYDNGLDFYVKKTKKGVHTDYSTSVWARKESALTEAELQAIDQYGLYTLSSFLPKRPGETELKIIMEMFEASVAGEQYDPDKWAQYYKPYGLNTDEKSESDESESVVETAKQTVSSPVLKPEGAAKSKTAEEILAQIRNRPTN